jgi:hypothetical protein
MDRAASAAGLNEHPLAPHILNHSIAPVLFCCRKYVAAPSKTRRTHST